MKMKIRKLLLLFVLLSGCSASPEFSPSGDKLSEATIGEPYVTKIIITKARVQRNTFGGEFTQRDSGLFIENCKYHPEMQARGDDTDFNCAIVKGIPRYSGTIELTIYGDLYGDMLSPSSSFEKKYTITVREK